MNLNDLLRDRSIDPTKVLVFRHRPSEPELNKALPWLAAERHELFNAYQQTFGASVEGALKRLEGVGHVASFIGHEPKKALFIGLYEIRSSRPLSKRQFWEVQAYCDLKKLGMEGFTDDESRKQVLWFDLAATEFYAEWKGKLVIGWPPPERSWWRRAHNNEMSVQAILEESALDRAMPAWNDLVLAWDTLAMIPKSWRHQLTQWRGIYYILDASDRKGYVGSAGGAENILGRWLGYAKSSDGGNRLLKHRNPSSFRFSILERVSPDLGTNELVQLENTWKVRLGTRKPFGLNDN